MKLRFQRFLPSIGPNWQWDKQTVGFYETLEKKHIYATSKPSAWHRWWSKVLLGWEWWDEVSPPDAKNKEPSR